MKNDHLKILNFSLLIIHFALLSFLFAGAPDTLWTRTYGGAEKDWGESVQQTNDGGFIITGETSSFGAGSKDVYLIRTDSNGDTIWTKTYGGNQWDFGYSVLQTNDGGFIIAGNTYSFGSGGGDVYLIRTNSNGDMLWTKTYGGINGEAGFSIQHENVNGFIIVGEITYYDSSENESDVYLLRTDSNGDTLWTRTFGGANEQWGYSVQQTNDSGFIISGYSGSFSTGKVDAYLVRTDSNGDSLWTKAYGGPFWEWGSDVKQTSDGGFVITGLTQSFGPGGQCVYVVRTDSNGDTLWTKGYGGTDSDIGYSIHQTGDGGFIINGGTSSFGAGGIDVYLIRTNSDGDTLWTKTYGGPKKDLCKSSQKTSDGGLILVGSTSSFGDTLDDVYLIRLEPEVGIHDIPKNSLKPINFLVSSSQGNISIRYTIPFSTRIKLEAFDIQGRLVEVIEDRFMQKGSYGVTWDAERFGAGIYFVRLSANGAEVSRKVTRLR